MGAKDDVKEILAHPFFKDLDIEKLMKKQLVPPYLPDVDSQ
jgi:hypothetical protein